MEIDQMTLQFLSLFNIHVQIGMEVVKTYYEWGA